MDNSTSTGEYYNKNPKTYTIDEAIEKAGGFGLYQWIYVTLNILLFCPAGIVIYNLSYLTIVPVLMCPQPGQNDAPCKDIDMSKRALLNLILNYRSLWR